MFEKEAEEWVIDNVCKDCSRYEKCKSKEHCTCKECSKEKWKYGAEFGYNKAKVEVEDSYRESLCNSELNLASVTEQLEELEKANEWHYVSEKGTPKKEGHYLVCLRNKDKDIFDCWIYYDEDVGWYSMKVRMKDIYAWKEIVLPEEIKENDSK